MRKYCYIIYDEYKEKLISEISKGSFKISLTSNIWSSQNNSNYLCVTVHYIDNNWILQKRILSFIELEYQHTARILWATSCALLMSIKLKILYFQLLLIMLRQIIVLLKF